MLEVYDPFVAKIEAVLKHRRGLVKARTLMLHVAQDQITKLPTEIRDQLTTNGKTEGRLRRLEDIELDGPTTPSGDYRLAWLLNLADQDRTSRREIRRLERLIDALLDEHGTTLRDEDGIGPITAATLVCEVGDPFRFSRKSKFARWSGTGAVALSSGKGAGLPVRHRLDFRGNRRINSVLYVASVTQQRTTKQPASTSTARPAKARPAAKPDAHTTANSPTASSAARGATRNNDDLPSQRVLSDKGASDRPPSWTRDRTSR